MSGVMVEENNYDRPHERFTWRGALHCCFDPKTNKRKGFKILSEARNRGVELSKYVPGSCVWYSLATALEAANRACGVEVDRLSWEELHDLVGIDNPCRVTAALRALKYRGIRREVDYKKGNINAKRFKVSQFYEFCNVDLYSDGKLPCGLDQHNIKGAIDSFLSKTVMVASFPLSHNYADALNGFEHIYEFDINDPIYAADGSGRIVTHAAVITGFGFDENVPYLIFR